MKESRIFAANRASWRQSAGLLLQLSPSLLSVERVDVDSLTGGGGAVLGGGGGGEGRPIRRALCTPHTLCVRSDAGSLLRHRSLSFFYAVLNTSA